MAALATDVPAGSDCRKIDVTYFCPIALHTQQCYDYDIEETQMYFSRFRVIIQGRKYVKEIQALGGFDLHGRLHV